MPLALALLKARVPHVKAQKITLSALFLIRKQAPCSISVGREISPACPLWIRGYPPEPSSRVYASRRSLLFFPPFSFPFSWSPLTSPGGEKAGFPLSPTCMPRTVNVVFFGSRHWLVFFSRPPHRPLHPVSLRPPNSLLPSPLILPPSLPHPLLPPLLLPPSTHPPPSTLTPSPLPLHPSTIPPPSHYPESSPPLST